MFPNSITNGLANFVGDNITHSTKGYKKRPNIFKTFV